MDRICANHDIIIREGKTECPTCNEVRYPVEEIDRLRKQVEELNRDLRNLKNARVAEGMRESALLEKHDRYRTALGDFGSAIR